MPELSFTALSVINALLFLLYLPLGFMGWAFAAAALANNDPQGRRAGAQRWVLAAALTPGVALLALAIAPHTLAEPWATRAAWVPLAGAGLLFALICVGSLVAGFVAGIAERRGPPV